MTADVVPSPPNTGLLSRDTAESLKAIARTKAAQDNNNMSLPEINSVADLVVKVAPAGDALGVILNGLTRLPGRRLPQETVRKDLNLLFESIGKARDSAVFGAFFAGPAAVIWAYQSLLRLAGKNPTDAFPDGMWQFYVEYAMREDTARHANETRGFDAALRAKDITLTPADRVTAWVMAAAHCLYSYPILLANEWRERVAIETLRAVCADLPEAAHYAQLYRQWEMVRPFDMPPEGEATSYSEYRRQQFGRFMEKATAKLPVAQGRAWAQKLRALEQTDLPTYQRQLSLLAYLEPGVYDETRIPFAIGQAHIGVIRQGRYFLVPVCAPGANQLASIQAIRSQVVNIFEQPAPSKAPNSLIPLAEVKRTAWPDLRPKLSASLVNKLDLLRTAPILLNFDPRAPNMPLARLRLAERGVGDHGLTVFDSGDSFVFDQSHIFFDGVWGAALAEIMTDEATHWALYLSKNPERVSTIRKAIAVLQGKRVEVPPPRALDFRLSENDLNILNTAPRREPEASAETEEVNLGAILAQRDLLRKRNEKLRLTVNDFLVLYRAIHAATYRVDSNILKDLSELTRDPRNREALSAVFESLDSTKQVNPAMLIPIDASQRAPRDRLQPMNYEVPLTDLNLLKLHADTLMAMHNYKQALDHERATRYEQFDKLQREYLATLAGFGEMLAKAKEITLRGEGAATGTMKLLAHMPAAIQNLLHKIPGRFDVLNDLIQGREVFSNVGAVAATSSLTRFLTAKDDHGKKALAWGFLTDAEGIMRITLRDFRPHVALLASIGHLDLADRLAQHYLDAYAEGLNHYIRDLRHIVLTVQDSTTRKAG